MLSHKNGYLLNLTKVAKSYNSMAHGLAVLVELEVKTVPFACQFLIEKGKRIISATSTVISVLELDLKGY